MATQSKPAQQQRLTPVTSALVGALGGCFSSAVVYPLDVAKTRIQATPSRGKNKDDLSMLSVVLKIYRKEGIAGLYRGFGATMLNTFSMQYAYFFFYSFIRTSYITRLTKKLPPGAKLAPLSTATELLLGAIAGVLAQIFTIPVSVIATRQQVGRMFQRQKLPTSTEERTDESFLAVGREIVKEEGIAGLWSGLQPSLVLTANPAITYGMFERVKNIVLLARGKFGSNVKMTPWLAFLIGALSKTLATIVTYPYIMAKVRIQARSTDADDDTANGNAESEGEKGRQPGAVDILIRTWRRQGFRGWYQGMQAQITKAVLSQALLFMSKEQFEQWALQLMVTASRFS
ncbi:hypothetical protein AX15_004144 [Amanita polypyramis BW_CC]|nr:hypothetical protein AX15_004144 [Amanita polypyramis BW_CC]